MRTFPSLPGALLLVVIPLLASSVVAAPSSACPPVMGERESMLGILHSIGTNNQLGRLCKVAELTIQHKTQAQLAPLKACLRERNIKDADADAEIRAGAVDGQQGYEQSAAKDSMCEVVREQFSE